MRIAITGGTGFLGRYIVKQLAGAGHSLRLWYRPESPRDGFEGFQEQLEWVPGYLCDEPAERALVEGCDAVVHAALWRPGQAFRGGEGDVVPFAETNLMGSLRLIEAARAADAARFVFISTCAVHEKILDDRPLDESHPSWPTSHYGAHKAAIEKFIYSYGLGDGYQICALRPTGIYGAKVPLSESKWFRLARAVASGEDVDVHGGGKEVHASDVAKAVELLLNANNIAGQAYNCYDMYVSQYDVATIAKRLTGSRSEIRGEPSRPKHQIETGKLRALGMQFGGRPLLEATIAQLAEAE